VKVVFDTSVLFDHWFLDGPNFELLESFADLTDVSLIVPEIVKLELVKKYYEVAISLIAEREKHLEKAKRTRQRLESMGVLHSEGEVPGAWPDGSPTDIDTIVARYTAALTGRLSSLGVLIPGYVGISQESILGRCLSGRKPFRAGKGYRDSLIWEVILNDVADASDITFFVTANHKDFAEADDSLELHLDLKDDLRSRGLPQDCVRLCNSIERFVSENVVPSMRRLEEAKVRFEAGDYDGFSLEKWIAENRPLIMDALQNSVDSLLEQDHSLSQLMDADIVYIEDPVTVHLEEVLGLGVDKIYLRAYLKAELSIDAFVDKSDYNFLSEDIELSVWDADWNEHSMLVSVSVITPINLYLLFDIKDKSVVRFEASFLDSYGWCRHCGEPIMSDAAECCPSCGKSWLLRSD
jgi:hypothetical protein